MHFVSLCVNVFCTLIVISATATTTVLVASAPTNEDLCPAETWSTDDLDTLELVQILYRHGDRTPYYGYPNDPHNSYWETHGAGQLTNLGKEQHYELGNFIRQRYAGFLNASYNLNEVVIRSTDVDRTLMSAEANLAGLYPPSGDQVWNRNLDWQPIPVHTIPESVDYLLNTEAWCPKYDEVQDLVMNSSEVRQINDENMELYEFLTNATGMSVDNFLSTESIYDTLFVEKNYNLSMPDWLNDTTYERLHYLATMCFYYDFVSPAEQRLRGGPLVKEMLANARDKVNGKIDKRRAFIYSAHDSTMTAVLSTLGIFNNILVPYAAALFVELHRPQSAGFPFTVRIFYRNSTTGGEDEPFELKVPHCAPTCGMYCPLDRLAEIVSPLLPGNITVECGVQPDDLISRIEHAPPSRQS